MSERNPARRFSSMAILAALSLLLTGCFLTPGKFTAELQLKADDTFSFTYDGEIFFLGLSKLAQMGAASDSDEFMASECYDDDAIEERACTEAELAEQKSEWEAGAESRRKNREMEASQMAAMMGGIDPSDPKAAAEFAERLERQRGWERVVHQGDGLFDVQYRISGRLSHDVVFPVIEGLPVPTPFVQVVLRDANEVRVDAPGFAVQEGNNPMAGLMMGGFAAGMAESAGTADAAAGMENIPEIDGTFTLVTDGRILANNTDEGPVQADARQTLTWKVSKRTKVAPTALIKLGN